MGDLTREKPFLISSSGKIHVYGCGHVGKLAKKVGLTPKQTRDASRRQTCTFCVFKFPRIAEVVWDE